MNQTTELVPPISSAMTAVRRSPNLSPTAPANGANTAPGIRAAKATRPSHNSLSVRLQTSQPMATSWTQNPRTEVMLPVQ